MLNHCEGRKISDEQIAFPTLPSLRQSKSLSKKNLHIDFQKLILSSLLSSLVIYLVKHCKYEFKRSSQLRTHRLRAWIFLIFFQVLFSTTSSVVFLAARISEIRFFTAVQIYEFHISKVIVHCKYFSKQIAKFQVVVTSLNLATTREKEMEIWPNGNQVVL